ncbi:succinic semialdehyde dehydrogenase [Nocardioides sp. zg-DK7169]|uniref:succinic semialdehyde dehydrogenase n=1 Tax=Nocardioides sp. zg-DK7169 TaxID=2736600 RepID=UPI001551D786|nr:succinic semialdehyde dehydrogenase [Nocardioides sp. zg-DK7169]NPC98887.1 succinate-semialdehyde dehydrogenase (NADP(+)) [Nocardioides sp. zg-DK7169]
MHIASSSDVATTEGAAAGPDAATGTPRPGPTRPASITDAFLRSLVARVPSSGATPWPLTEVYTGEKLVDLPQSSPSDIEEAFARAREAQRVWAAWPVRKRMRVFRTAHRLLLEATHTTADLIQAESGKNRRMAVEETCDPPMVISHYLKRAPRLLSSTTRGGPVPLVSSSTEIRRPKGVVAIIAPWNFPFATGLSDAIPALMAGNAVVLKPDNKTALSPLHGIALLERAGLPKGLFQVVCGEGPDVGPTLIDNASYVMFTGSTATGRVIGERAGRNLIGCCLELGGKNPMVVLDDVDADEWVDGALFGVFGNTGQICMHIERIYLPDSRYEELKAAFVKATEALVIGAAYDFGPDVGSLISPDHLARVYAHVEDAVAKGAHVVTGGRARPDLGPAFFEPTILEGVTSEMACGVTETFGPVVALHRYRTVEEAIALANDTDYGLNASVWSGDVARAEKVARRIEAGNVNVNDALATAYASKGTPSGGIKQSGVGARHGDQGLLKYTDVQNLAVLKKQVMGIRPGQDYDTYVEQMLGGLKMMRRFRIR